MTCNLRLFSDARKNGRLALSYQEKYKSTQDNHVLGTFSLELLARFELATRFPRNRGFVEALRPRIEILSAYADRADEAASFPDGRYKK